MSFARNYGREGWSARVYSEPLGEVNGSTTKLGASYFFDVIPSAARELYTIDALKVEYPPKGGFFIELITLLAKI